MGLTVTDPEILNDLGGLLSDFAYCWYLAIYHARSRLNILSHYKIISNAEQRQSNHGG